MTDAEKVRNKSTTFWDRSDRHLNPNPDLSGNQVSNPGSLSVEVRHLGRGSCSLKTE